MPLVVVAATLDFATQADRDEAVRLTAPVQMGTRNEEAGCHAYCFAADPGVPNRIQVHELWESAGTLAAHFKHPYYAKMVEVLRGVGIVDTWNQVYEVARHAPVYGPEGGANPEFFGDDA